MQDLIYGTDFNITEGVDSRSTGLSYVTFQFLPTEDKYLENLRVNTISYQGRDLERKPVTRVQPIYK